MNVKISGGVGYVEAYLTELASAQGLDKRFDTFLNGLKDEFVDLSTLEYRSRSVVENLAMRMWLRGLWLRVYISLRGLTMERCRWGLTVRRLLSGLSLRFSEALDLVYVLVSGLLFQPFN